MGSLKLRKPNIGLREAVNSHRTKCYTLLTYCPFIATRVRDCSVTIMCNGDSNDYSDEKSRQIVAKLVGYVSSCCPLPLDPASPPSGARAKPQTPTTLSRINHSQVDMRTHAQPRTSLNIGNSPSPLVPPPTPTRNQSETTRAKTHVPAHV